MILFGWWGWISVGKKERRVVEAERISRLTMDDHLATGIPDNAPPPFDWRLFGGIILLIFGLPLMLAGIGILMVAGSGFLLWKSYQVRKVTPKVTGRARFFPEKPDPVIGGELRGQVWLPPGLHPDGPTSLMLVCEQQTLEHRYNDPDRLNQETLGEPVRRNLESSAWQTAEGGLFCAVVMPLRGGRVSSGAYPPVQYDQPTIVWLLKVEVPQSSTTRKLEFTIPVQASVAPEKPPIPPEIADAARDILGPGNPTKVGDFLVERVVATAVVAGVKADDIPGILAAAGITEVLKQGAVGGRGLQMDAGASRTAQRFMNTGVGCVVVMCIGLSMGALMLLAIPYVGWLLSLAAVGVIVWIIRGAWADKQKISREPELLWVEPGQLCYRLEMVTEQRLSLA